MIASTSSKPVTLKELLGDALRDQQDLSAVERFANDHDAGMLDTGTKAYAKLLPATPPGPGQQYAFSVDLDSCTGCKACVVACHNLNGLEEKETWRSTGLLLGGTLENPFQQTVTTACHHCVEPACLNGCPVNAYEKDPVTGIVHHLDDQCIGCKYCTLTCPYDVPQFSKSKGIVRKCDMCSSRLAVGEAPACVQACPNQAIRIDLVQIEHVVERSEAGSFLAGAAPPDLTLPTTNYRSKRPLPPNVLPADYHRVRKEDAHIALVFMLVLTQLSVGTFVWDFLWKAFWGGGANTIGKSFYSFGALALGIVALSASLFHLGRPQYAFRAMLGLKRSWLSREILAFGLYAGAAGAYAFSLQATGLFAWLGEPDIQQGLFYLTIISGLGGVFSSIMVYSVTGRPLWKFSITTFKFAATSLLLGLSLTLLVSTAFAHAEWESFLTGSGRTMAFLVITLTGLKIIQEGGVFFHLRDTLQSPHRRAATLMLGAVKIATRSRFVTALLGGIFAPLLLAFTDPSPQSGVIIAGCSFITLVISELLERYLYFTTSVSARMPGGPVA